MVATPNKKKSRFTYADRVVGALSDVQRQHKKHAVHIATLRAQVRKNAEVHKDPLGPQWSNWVYKAVAKLEEHGVLEQTKTSYIAFTTNAKKTIVAARRQTITSMPGTPARIAPELYIAKSVTQSKVSGVKRRRRSSVATRGNMDTEDETDYETPTKTVTSSRRQTLPNKRARRSSVNALSRLTKAELLARVAALEEEDDDTPNTISRLQRELQSTRVLLQKAQRQQPAADTNSYDVFDRELTPLSDAQDELSRLASPSAMRPSAAESISAPRPQLVLRTESDCIINRQSKQATPAPSAFEHDDEADDEDSEPGVDRADVRGVDQGLSNGLATPMSIRSPIVNCPELRHVEADSGDETCSDHGTPPDSQLVDLSILRTENGQLSAKYGALEELVASQKATITSLQLSEEAKVNQIAAQLADLRSTQNELSELRVQVSTLTASLQDKDSAIEDADADVTTKQTLVTALQNALGERVVELEACQQALSVSQVQQADDSNCLRRGLVNFGDALRDLQSQLVAGSSASANVDELLEDAKQRFAHFLAKPTQRASDVHNGWTFVNSIRGLQEEINCVLGLALEIAAQAAESQKAAAFARSAQALGAGQCSALESQLEHLKAYQLELEGSLADLTADQRDRDSSIAQLTTELSAERERLGSTRMELAELVSVQAVLQSTLDDRVVEAAALEARLAEAEKHEAVLRSDFRALQDDKLAQAKEYESRITALEASVSAADTQTGAIQTQWRNTEAILRQREQSLQQNSLALAEATIALAQEKGRTSAMKQDLQNAADTTLAAEMQCNELRRSEAYNEEQIRNMKEAFYQFTAMQRAGLSELDAKMTSIQPSSAPAQC